MKKIIFLPICFLVLLSMLFTNCNKEEEKYVVEKQYALTESILNLSIFQKQNEAYSKLQVGIGSMKTLWQEQVFVYDPSIFPETCGSELDSVRFTSIDFFDQQSGEITTSCGMDQHTKSFNYVREHNILTFSLYGFDFKASMEKDGSFRRILCHNVWKFNGYDQNPAFDFIGFYPAEVKSFSYDDENFFLVGAPIDEEYVNSIFERTNLDADTLAISTSWITKL